MFIRELRPIVAAVLLSLAVSLPLVAGPGESDPVPYPMLPEAISSFGAAVSGDYLYVLSGHMGRVPGNSIDGLSPHFTRLNLKQPGSQHEELALHHPSQSPGLVAWRDQIYRVGGLSFKNRAGEETAFQSLDVFTKYDPQSNTWKDLAPLPAPRSSLDAAVVGDRLYVVGGWNLQAGSAQDAPWHEDALVFDLTQDAGQWKTIAKPPFIKRALAVAAHDQKLYVLGGMNQAGSISKDVHIYDPASDTWSQGPALPGRDNFSGFAISAFAAGGQLYFNGTEGIVYRLNSKDSSWQAVERLVYPRSFHRLVPANDQQLVAIAGVARGGGYLANIEVIDVGGDKPKAMKFAQWSVEFAGKVKQGQALVLNGPSLYAFGGNNSRAPHDFAKQSFVDEAYRFDVASRTVEKLPNLPQSVQAAGAQIAGSRVDQSIYVFGGLAHPGEKFGSVDTILQYRLRSKAWSDEVTQLPTSRAMFHSVSRDGAFWLFGGSRVNTSDTGLVKETWKWNITAEEPPTMVPNADIPVPRRSFAGAVLDGQYYAVGGLGADSKIVAVTNVFDFKTEQWSDAPAPKVARVFPNLAVAAGKLYLYGGFATIDGHFEAEKSLEAFDPITKTWETVLAELPFDGRQMSLIEYQDRLLFYGIDRTKDGLAHFAVLDPSPATVGFGNVNSVVEERGPADDLIARLMRLDKNKDGSLTRDEIGARFQPLLSRVDENQDGTATKDEIAAFVRKEAASQAARDAGPRSATGRDPALTAGRILEEHDQNKDGKLSGDEIPDQIKKNLERIDLNKDGVIEKAELEADARKTNAM